MSTCIRDMPTSLQLDHWQLTAFIRRFGSSLVDHMHIHVCVVDELWHCRRRAFVTVGHRCIAGLCSTPVFMPTNGEPLFTTIFTRFRTAPNN